MNILKKALQLLFFVATLFLISILIFNILCNAKAELPYIETGAKIIALFLAACFFGYKLITGWLIINLQIELDVQREPIANSSHDHLVINIRLTKGSTDSLWLRKIYIAVYEDSNGNDITLQPYSTTNHRLIEAFNTSRSKVVDDTMQAENKNRLLNLSPGEKTQFSAYTKVPIADVVALDVMVIATRPLYNLRDLNFKNKNNVQWKASTIVLPKRRV